MLGAKVLVTGCGPIGSLLIGALRRAGAELIVAADVAALPLKCAMDMGADLAINLATEPDALAAYKADKARSSLILALYLFVSYARFEFESYQRQTRPEPIWPLSLDVLQVLLRLEGYCPPQDA